MGRHQATQLPRDVVRDLLGIARALYATRRADGAPSDELVRLEQAGNALVLALELSLTLPDTLGHRAAWSWAEKGLAHLCAAVASDDDSVAALVSAWSGRLQKAGG